MTRNLRLHAENLLRFGVHILNNYERMLHTKFVQRQFVFLHHCTAWQGRNLADPLFNCGLGYKIAWPRRPTVESNDAIG